MARLILNNSGTTTYPLKMRITYTENGSGITITKVEGCRTDSTRSYEVAGIVYLDGKQFCTYPDFPAKSAWKAWWTGSKVLSSYNGTFTFKSTQSSIQNSKFTFNITATKYNLYYTAHPGVKSFTGPATANLNANITTSAEAETGYYLDHYIRKRGENSVTITECHGKKEHAQTFSKILGNTAFGAYAAAYTCKVVFHKNDGGDAVYSETYTAGVDNQKFGMNLTSSSGDFGAWSRTGHTLKGWATSKTATTPTYAVFATLNDTFIEKHNEGLDVYGVWEADTYTISYNANGGTGAPSSQTKTYGVDLTLRTTKPSLEGHNFIGWATSKTATTATYQPGGTFKINANTILYAVWSPYTHTVAFNANGGNNAPESITKIYGTDRTISYIQPIRAGYIFKGWGTSASTTTVAYLPGDKYTRDQNGGTYTLYAIWSNYIYFKINDEWKAVEIYIKTNNSWKIGDAFIKKDSTWMQ